MATKFFDKVLEIFNFFPQASFEELNSITYSEAAIKHLYTNQKWLPVEASVLLDYSSAILSKRVLELGAGSGRIASVLMKRSDHYCATDINQNMISTLCKVHPGVNAKIADARNLKGFNSNNYDTIIFSFNGIDCLPYKDRHQALNEIYRVLKVGGLFIHSTHNVSHAKAASHKPNFTNSNRSVVEYITRVLNRYRLSRLEYFSEEYALVNDRALKNGLLNVYIDPKIHFSQLKNTGFEIENIYERDGHRLHPGELPNDQWFYCVARKVAK